jgi:hypothetical protein
MGLDFDQPTEIARARFESIEMNRIIMPVSVSGSCCNPMEYSQDIILLLYCFSS